MSIYQGTHFQQRFQLTNKSDGVAIDLSGWEFNAMFRTQVSDETVLLTLTSPVGFVSSTTETGIVTMSITPAQTEELPIGGVVFDVMRTDVAGGPVFLFSGKIKVKQPVTR